MARYLTKSLFKKGDECPTKLFYTRKESYPDNQEGNEFLQGLAKGGYQVGEYAKLHYPGGVEITNTNKEEASAETALLLQREHVVIYEAAIKVGDRLYALVDILVKRGRQVDLIEVKSKLYSSGITNFRMNRGDSFLTSEWRPYLLDVAFQTWLARQAFPELTFTPKLMLLNKDSQASVDGINTHFKIINLVESGKFIIQRDPHLTIDQLGCSLLKEVDVTEEVDVILARQESDPGSRHPEEPSTFTEWVHWLAVHYHHDQKINPHLTADCKSCEFRVKPDRLKYGQHSGFEECWHAVPERPLVFDIWNYRRTRSLIKKQVYAMTAPEVIEGLPNAEALKTKSDPWSAADRQAIQVHGVIHQLTDEVVNPGLFAEMARLPYPLKFIDFEAGTLALPFSRGQRPYEKVAFQFSIHTLYEDGRLEHTHEWISVEPGVNPNPGFVSALQQAIEPFSGTLLSYSSFEGTTLQQLSEQLQAYPDLQAFLKRHEEQAPFADMLKMLKEYYYHPATHGSNSIKHVLPAIARNDPYKKLEPIPSYRFNQALSRYEADDSEQLNDGGKAMMAWAELQFTDVPDERRTQVKQALLRYCELDTEAMAKIWMHWMRLGY